MNKKSLVIFISIPFILACGLGRLTDSTNPSQVSTPSMQIRRTSETTYCPTDNEQARQAYNQAVDLEERGGWEQAMILYQQAIELDPGFCDAMDNLGLIYRQIEDLDQAAYWYRNSISTNPQNPVPYQNLGVVYELEGKIPDSMEQYQTMMQLFPDNPEGFFGAGALLVKYSSSPGDGIPLLQAAVDRYEQGGFPQEFILDAKYYIGMAYYLLEDFQQAHDSLLEIYPEMQSDASVHYALGVCYLSPELFDLEQARYHLRRAEELGIELSPEIEEQIK